MRMTKLTFTFFVTLMIFVFPYGFLTAQESVPQEEPEKMEIRDVQQLTATLEKITGVYSHDREQLEKSRKEVEKLRRKAEGAKVSRVGVALFRELSGTIRRFFNSSGPDGLLQDVFQEALFDTQARSAEKEKFQFWMGNNFRRRKELKKNYELLEQVLKAPLESGSGAYLTKITRRLDVIIRASDELSKKIGESMAQLEKDRQEMGKMIRELRKGPSAAAPASPDQSVSDGKS